MRAENSSGQLESSAEEEVHVILDLLAGGTLEAGGGGGGFFSALGRVLLMISFGILFKNLGGGFDVSDSLSSSPSAILNCKAPESMQRLYPEIKNSYFW